MVLLFLSRNTISEGGSVALAVNYTGFLQQESAISLDLLTILESGEASGRKGEVSALNSVIKHVHVWKYMPLKIV